MKNRNGDDDMKTTLVKAFVVGAVAVGLVAVAVAQAPVAGGRGKGGPGMRQGMGPGGPGMRQGMGPGGPGPMAALKLTDEQRTQIQAIQEKHRLANQDQAEQLRNLHEQLRAALFGETPDRALELAGQVAQMESQLLPSRVGMQIEIVKLLTPEQKKTALQLNLFGPNGQMGPGGRGR
jgi:Spy/CpxP family protein refolding chaperone